jgi:hypothetical protein
MIPYDVNLISTWSRNPHASHATPGKQKNQVWKYDTEITLNLNTNIIGIWNPYPIDNNLWREV